MQNFSFDYHYHREDGDLRIRAHLGELEGVPLYTVVELGPVVFYNLTPAQLRELAAASEQAANDLEDETKRRFNELAQEFSHDEAVAEPETAAE